MQAAASYAIALGANLPSAVGAPRATLEAALAALPAEGLRVVRASSWYRTPAFPPGAGPDFVNGAALLAGELPPAAVLAALHRVEAALGRSRGARWEPRACDLDLLASGDRVLPDAATVAREMARPYAGQGGPAPRELILPHPRLHQRAFVLVPLADVAPDWVHPLTGRSVRAMVATLPAAARAGIVRLP